MFAKWLEEYRRLSDKTRFVSKLGTFIVSLFAFLSCWRILEALSSNPSAWNYLGNNIVVSVSFHLLIGAVFAAIFASLFFAGKRIFWFAQTFRAIGLLSIAGFFITTRFVLYGSFFAPESELDFGMHNYPKIFLYADYSFEFFACIYFLTSPIRQIISAIFAFINSK